MIDAFYIGATGMQAQQFNVDTIANNLANANTPGFKRSRVSFCDLMVRETGRLLQSGNTQTDTGRLGSAQQLSAGVGTTGLARMFETGDLKKTDSSFDVAIQGDGFIEVSMPDGSRAYTRGGTLKVTRDGQLATQAGYALKPGITIPDNAQSITISNDGRVQVQMTGQTSLVEAGQLELVRFASPGQLTAQGDNLFRASDASGEPIQGRAGEDGMGTVAQGFLEASNVKLVEEMVNLMVAQRAYEASVKVVQASDEMLGIVNNLRK